MGYGGAAYTRLHNSKMHQDQSSDPLHVFPGKMQKRIVMAISFLRQALFVFFSGKRDLF